MRATLRAATAAVLVGSSGVIVTIPPPRDFLEQLKQADEVAVCVFRGGVPSMKRSGFNPNLLRRFRARGCVPLKAEMRAQLENMLADPRSWNSPILPKSDRPDPVNTRFVFRFTHASEVSEIRYLPETGRLEAWAKDRRVAQGYCGEQGEWMNLVMRCFPSDREIASLAPGYKIDPHRRPAPCGDGRDAPLPDPPFQASPGPRRSTVVTPSISVEAILDLPSGWHLPPGPVDPWSPDGRLLAISYYDEKRCSDGLYLFDMDRPSHRPRRVMGGGSPCYAWSPDGKWLAWALWGYNNWGSLMVSSAEGAGTFAIVDAMQFGPFVWDRDGRIMFWNRPDGSTPNSNPAFPAISVVARKRLPLSRLDWGNVRTWKRAQGRTSTPSKAALDSRQAALASFYERTGTEYQVLEDRKGRVVALLSGSDTPSGRSPWSPPENDGIMWTSASSDRSTVIGYLEFVATDYLENSQLFLAYPDSVQSGDAIVPGIPLGLGDGTWPRFSPREPLLAYEDPKRGGVHVVRVARK